MGTRHRYILTRVDGLPYPSAPIIHQFPDLRAAVNFALDNFGDKSLRFVYSDNIYVQRAKRLAAKGETWPIQVPIDM